MTESVQLRLFVLVASIILGSNRL